MPWWAVMLSTVGSSITVTAVTIGATKLVKIQRDVATMVQWFDKTDPMVLALLDNNLPDAVVALKKWKDTQRAGL